MWGKTEPRKNPLFVWERFQYISGGVMLSEGINIVSYTELYFIQKVALTCSKVFSSDTDVVFSYVVVVEEQFMYIDNKIK